MSAWNARVSDEKSSIDPGMDCVSLRGKDAQNVFHGVYEPVLNPAGSPIDTSPTDGKQKQEIVIPLI